MEEKNKQTNSGYLCSHFWYGWYSEPYPTEQYEVCVHLCLNQPVLPICVQQVSCCSAAMLNFIYSVTNPSSILFCVLVVCLLCIVARKINRTNKTNKQTYTPHPKKSYALKYASSITIHVHRRRPSPVRPARHLPAVVPPRREGISNIMTQWHRQTTTTSRGLGVQLYLHCVVLQCWLISGRRRTKSWAHKQTYAAREPRTLPLSL